MADESSEPETYPAREAFFSHRFVRLLTKICVANEVGAMVAWLLTVIVHQEDSARYARGVTFWDGQLAPLIGVSLKTLRDVRQKAVEAGFLHYEPGSKGKVARYWVLVPPHLESIVDSSVDEGQVKENPDECEVNFTANQSQNGLTTDAIVTRKGTPSYPIPFPDPIPNKETPQAAGLGAGTNSESRPQKTTKRTRESIEISDVTFPSTLDSPEFRAAFAEWFVHRREIKKPVTALASKKLITRCEGWGIDRSIKAINYSIENSYVGLFEPATQGVGKHGSSSNATHNSQSTGRYDPAVPVQNNF